MANHICPWWAGYLLANPLRRIIENPEKMIAPFVRPGMYVIDYGCGMGFFTLPLAKMVGPTGKVIAVDVQGKMLNTLRKKAHRSGLSDRVTILASGAEKNIKECSVDFVTALYVIHEIVEQHAFFEEMYRVMKPGSKILIVEPRFHVNEEDFRRSIETGTSSGFVSTTGLDFPRGLRAILSKAQ